MIHRRVVGEQWETCASTAQGHEPDSRLHRYDRVVGFMITDEEQAQVDRNERLAATTHTPPATAHTDTRLRSHVVPLIPLAQCC